MQDSFFASLGVAYYMGFKKIYLVGMDYFSDVGGHFYEFGKGWNWPQKISKEQLETLNNFSKLIDIYLVNPKNYKSKLFKSIEFEELTNSKELFRENHQIVNPLYLNYMNDLDMEYRIYNI